MWLRTELKQREVERVEACGGNDELSAQAKAQSMLEAEGKTARKAVEVPSWSTSTPSCEICDESDGNKKTLKVSTIGRIMSCFLSLFLFLSLLI